MPNTLLERLHKPQPALAVKYGNAEKRYLALDRIATVLGRARGCDIELNAPEVSAIHCVISREGVGLYIRDCSSRAGTRVNGEMVQESPLHDGDVLHIGSFSFEVHLPGVYLAAAKRPGVEEIGGSRSERIARSRRRFARLALRYRRLLRAEKQARKEVAALEPGAVATPQTMEEMVRARLRQYEEKLKRLQEAERLLAEDREALRREWAQFRTRVEHFDKQKALTTTPIPPPPAR